MAAMRPDPPRGSDGRAIAKFAAVKRNRADRMARNRMQHCSVGVMVRQETSSVPPLSNSSPVPLGSRGFSLNQTRAPYGRVMTSYQKQNRLPRREDEISDEGSEKIPPQNDRLRNRGHQADKIC